MKRRWGFVLFLVGSISYATSPKASESELTIDKKLFDRLYETSRAAVAGDSASTSNYRVTIGFGILSPSQLTLANSYFSVSYPGAIDALPSLGLSIARTLHASPSFAVEAIGKGGFGFRDVTAILQSPSGQNFRDILRLHQLNLGLLLKLDATLARVGFVEPYLVAGGGANWLYQTGKLDGAEQAFWLPYVQAGIGATLFGAPGDSGFAGIPVTVSLIRSIGTNQSLEGMVIEAGVSFAL